MRTSLALASLALLLAAAPAMADNRSDRDRSTPAPSPASIIIPAPVVPSPISTPSHNSGSIKSTTGVSTNSGGNQGGTVTTGDQSATINVVNIGPVSQNTQVITPAPGQQPPAPSCSGRGCPRTR